jgi:hypothetical protein
VVHFTSFVSTFSEVSGNLGHNLGGEMDSFVFTGLEERWGLEVISEESSGFSKD